ncbi:MAG: S-adenosyl-L-homocysteine hydrolase [Proteobacteria bacterium]|nr:S-adenosyl-L-homocysteine hydrolase [Pseudomonadota bacterium]
MRKLMAGLAGVAVLAAVPARAETMSNAEKLRRLDIMLMVTGLRCRTGEDNFQPDFQRFEARHLPELNAAARSLGAEMTARLGRAGADRALDRISVSIANVYGGGHPWLGCHELKGVAQNLAEARGVEPLLAAADELLNGDGAPRIAYSER